jgi:hypothetical protein
MRWGDQSQFLKKRYYNHYDCKNDFWSGIYTANQSKSSWKISHKPQGKKCSEIKKKYSSNFATCI